RRIGLDDAFARASLIEAREQGSASLQARLGRLLLAWVDLPGARAVPGKWHLIEQWALAGACPVRDVKDERVDLQVVLYVRDAVDLRRLVELLVSGHPPVCKHLPPFPGEAVVPLVAARWRRGAELVDQSPVVQQAQPPP